MSHLTPLQLLTAIANGQTLKVHRDIDGNKAYRLHALDGAATSLESALVEGLLDRGLTDSNQKFPAATYRLTDAGRHVLSPQIDPHLNQ